MVVRFYPALRREKHNANVLKFFKQHHIAYTLIGRDEIRQDNRRLYGHDELPIVEVDGELFVNPNEGALKKILHITPEQAAS